MKYAFQITTGKLRKKYKLIHVHLTNAKIFHIPFAVHITDPAHLITSNPFQYSIA
jgi:hypothetical protein